MHNPEEGKAFLKQAVTNTLKAAISVLRGAEYQYVPPEGAKLLPWPLVYTYCEVLLNNSRHKADLEFVLKECLQPLQTELEDLKAQNALPVAEEELLASLGSGTNEQNKIVFASLKDMRTAADTCNPNAAVSHEVMLA